MGRVAFGGSGPAVNAGVIQDLDQNHEVRGLDNWVGTPYKIGIASKMMRDAHIRRSVDGLVAPLLSALWDFKPGDESPEAVEAADFCRWVFFERNRWDTVIKQATRYIRDGFALFEVTDDVTEVSQARFPLHPGSGSGITITGFHHRPAYTVYRWTQDELQPSQISAVEQWLPASDGQRAGFRTIPADRLVRLTWEQEGANYAGLAPLRSAYGPWKLKLTFTILSAIRHERQGVGIPRIGLPPEATDEEIDTATTILEGMRSNARGYLVLPDGFSFKWEETEQGGTAVEDAIEKCNRDIAFNLAQGFQLLGLSGGGGSYALSQTQEGQFAINLDVHADMIAACFNHGSDGYSPVKQLVLQNYGERVAVPVLHARHLPTRDWTKVLPVVHNLTMSGQITPDDKTEAFIREALMLPPQDKLTSRMPPIGMGAKKDTTDND